MWARVGGLYSLDCGAVGLACFDYDVVFMCCVVLSLDCLYLHLDAGCRFAVDVDYLWGICLCVDCCMLGCCVNWGAVLSLIG